MNRVGRRKAITKLLLLGASLPFSVSAEQRRRVAKPFGHGGARGNDELEWLPTECADERYPMQLILGELDCGDAGIVVIPEGKIVNNGWGEIGSRRLIGNPFGAGSTSISRRIHGRVFAAELSRIRNLASAKARRTATACAAFAG